MSEQLHLYAEWINGQNAYRLTHEVEPQTTFGYAGSITEAEGIARKLNCALELVDEKRVIYIDNIENTEDISFGPKHRLYVDMDGTLAEFKVVTYQEQLFEQGYFANLKPHNNVVDAVKDIIENEPDIEVYVLSAYLSDSEYALNEKMNGLIDIFRRSTGIIEYLCRVVQIKKKP